MRNITSKVELEDAKNKVIASLESTKVNAGYTKFSKEIQTKVTNSDYYFSNGIAIGPESANTSKNYLFFHVITGCDNTKTHINKGYLTFKDLNNFSITRFQAFLELLRSRNLNIDVKIFKDLAHIGALTNDQVVIHGNSKDDIATALDIAQAIFSSEISQTCIGHDKKVNNS